MKGRTLEQLTLLPMPVAPKRPATSTPAREDPADPFLDLDDADDLPFEVEPELEDAPDLRAVPPPAERFLRARALADEVSQRLGRPVQLSVTDNRSTMISYRRQDELLFLRVHHMFLDAPAQVVRAIADYAGKGKRAASAVIDAFVRENTTTIRIGHRAGPKARMRAQGKVYDLREIFERINDQVFSGRIDARIGWGRAPKAEGRRRTIRMGVYDHLTKTIRVHPALDRPEVPLFFVEYIVFHEMLHQAVPGEEKGRRRQHHGPEFKRREKAWPEYEKAIAWEQENLSMLLGKSIGKRARPAV
ncbi:MAG: hypothetical protein QM765_10470 [Myxococcales bacterium]